MNCLTVPEHRSQPLHEWLECATSFCKLVKSLDPEGVRGAACSGHNLPDGLHWDGETFLRAAGVATERFSRTAERFLRGIETSPFHVLTFSVEAGDPFMDSEVAILRIQRLANAGREQPTRAPFVPIGLRQRLSEPLLFGAEARIALLTPILDFEEMTPGVRFTYEVTGQHCLKVFASVLQKSAVQILWAAVGGFDVATSISLTKDDSHDSIDEEWTTSNDPDGKRLLKFCRKASRLSFEATSDWPPYLRLSCTLGSTNTQWDAERYFAAICAHTIGIVGPSGGSFECIEDAEARGLNVHA